MTKEMNQAAAGQCYEDAAMLRDRIKTIESLALVGDTATDVQPEVFFVDPREGLQTLAELLELEVLDQPTLLQQGVDVGLAVQKVDVRDHYRHAGDLRAARVQQVGRVLKI